MRGGDHLIETIIDIFNSFWQAIISFLPTSPFTAFINQMESVPFLAELNWLTAYLKTKGLEQIDAMGKEFDTDFHEAIAQFPVQEADKKNKVFDVTQHGYTLNGKVIRFAKVVVGI